MNRYDRIKEHLDSLSLQDLRFCTATGGCACVGCVGSVNGTAVREHEFIKYMMGTLVPGQQERSDIESMIFIQLQKHPAGVPIRQYGYVKDGNFWLSFIYRDKPEIGKVDIQVTGKNIFQNLYPDSFC